MKLFRFDPQVGITIEQFESRNAVMTRVAHITQPASVRCFYLDPGGIIGYHPASENQLFIVVDGEGQVRGQSDQFISIAKGQAALWEAGEWHESRTDTGMVAVVIEGRDLDPSEWMTAKNAEGELL